MSDALSPLPPVETTPVSQPVPTAEANLSYEDGHQSHGMRNFFFGLLAILILGTVAYGSYTLGQKSNEKQLAVTNSSPTTAALPTNTPTQTTASSSATYTDPVFGVSFSYPSTWEVTHTEALPSYWLRISPKGYHANSDTGPILLAIGMSQDNQPIVLKDFLHSTNNGTEKSVTTQVTIAGQLGYTQTLSSCEPFLCDIAAVTAHNNKAYILESFQFEQNPPDQKAVFQEILNTLQFTK